MNISYEILIETAINVLGYLLAGTFMVMIYAMVTRKKNKEVALAGNIEPVEVKVEDKKMEQKKSSDAKIEFVNFRQNSSQKPRISDGFDTKIGTEEEFHKARIEIMKQARQLMKDKQYKGAANDQ